MAYEETKTEKTNISGELTKTKRDQLWSFLRSKTEIDSPNENYYLNYHQASNKEIQKLFSTGENTDPNRGAIQLRDRAIELTKNVSTLRNSVEVNLLDNYINNLTPEQFLNLINKIGFNLDELVVNMINQNTIHDHITTAGSHGSENPLANRIANEVDHYIEVRELTLELAIQSYPNNQAEQLKAFLGGAVHDIAKYYPRYNESGVIIPRVDEHGNEIGDEIFNSLFFHEILSGIIASEIIPIDLAIASLQIENEQQQNGATNISAENIISNYMQLIAGLAVGHGYGEYPLYKARQRSFRVNGKTYDEFYEIKLAKDPIAQIISAGDKLSGLCGTKKIDEDEYWGTSIIKYASTRKASRTAEQFLSQDFESVDNYFFEILNMLELDLHQLDNIDSLVEPARSILLETVNQLGSAVIIRELVKLCLSKTENISSDPIMEQIQSWIGDNDISSKDVQEMIDYINKGIFKDSNNLTLINYLKDKLSMSDGNYNSIQQLGFQIYLKQLPAIIKEKIKQNTKTKAEVKADLDQESTSLSEISTLPISELEVYQNVDEKYKNMLKLAFLIEQEKLLRKFEDKPEMVMFPA